MTWRNQAACRGLPTEWWFPTGPITSDTMWEIDKAKTICATCPVQPECLEAGMDEEWGIWGGLGVRARWELGRTKSE